MNLHPDSTLVYANDRAGVARHIREVEKGLDCGCTCPGCGGELIAVNAKAQTYIKKPHFRHQHEPSTGHACADTSLTHAVQRALGEPTLIYVRQPRPPATTLFDDERSEEDLPDADRVDVLSFELVDRTEGLLRCKDGSSLRVLISASSKFSPETGNRFDLTLNVPRHVIDEFESFDELRQHLTLDQDCWRWCTRHSDPSLFRREVAPEPLRAPLISWVPVPDRPDTVANKTVATHADGSTTVRIEWATPGPWREGHVTLFHRRIGEGGVMLETVEDLPPKK